MTAGAVVVFSKIDATGRGLLNPGQPGIWNSGVMTWANNRSSSVWVKTLPWDQNADHIQLATSGSCSGVGDKGRTVSMK